MKRLTCVALLTVGLVILAGCGGAQVTPAPQAGGTGSQAAPRGAGTERPDPGAPSPAAPAPGGTAVPTPTPADKSAQAATAKTVDKIELNPPLGQDPKDVLLAPQARLLVADDMRQFKATPASKLVWQEGAKYDEKLFQLNFPAGNKMRPTGDRNQFYVQVWAGFLKPGEDILTQYSTKKKHSKDLFDAAWLATYVVEKQNESNYKVVAASAVAKFE